jgi:ligand-binding SRPBCC domain-containing protein
MRFVKESVFAASAATLFAFHERPDAFALLQPPWQVSEIVEPPTSLRVGTKVVIRVRLGPIWQTIEAEHVAYEPGRMFADRMVRGPFASWLHRHIVTPEGPDRSRLTDDIEYELPLGVLGRVFGGPLARRELERLFAFRHEATRAAVEGVPAAPRTT